jgi:hypothetical protein
VQGDMDADDVDHDHHHDHDHHIKPCDIEGTSPALTPGWCLLVQGDMGKTLTRHTVLKEHAGLLDCLTQTMMTMMTMITMVVINMMIML